MCLVVPRDVGRQGYFSRHSAINAGGGAQWLMDFKVLCVRAHSAQVDVEAQTQCDILSIVN